MLATLPLGADELSAWLRLANARGLKPAALRTLLGAFGLPQHVLAQPFEALAAAAGTEAARAVLAPSAADFAQQVAAVAAWCAQPGNMLVTLADPAYPPRLLTMPDPPPLLYVKGRLDLLHARSVAVVGSRSATPQALEDAARFARTLATAGVTVVSGLALGVDGAAHRGALDEPGGTVAVTGTGADLVYPPTHHALAARIAACGAVVTEWPLGTPARPANFPQRNRVIAALVEGVIVVEAAMRSGSLITARLANEMGRDVFALPGSVHAPLSRGCHRLIKEGAQLVETPEEVLEALRFTQPAPRARRAAAPRERASTSAMTLPLEFETQPVRPAQDCARTQAQTQAQTQARQPPIKAQTARAATLGPEARALLAALGHAPATLEILAQRTDMTEALLQATLLQLELAGHVSALPGGRFTRASHC